MSSTSLTRAILATVATVTSLGIASTSLATATAQAPSLGSATSQVRAASSQLGAAAGFDHLGRPSQETQAKIKAFADTPGLPSDVRNAILSGLAFATGEGGSGGPGLVKGGPKITQFYWPTVSGRCIGGQGDSVGSAIAVPGPTKIPSPGARAGETVFLFTALGTSSAAKKQGGMQVQWFNIDTFASGVTPLRNNGINDDGPTTVSGTAKTGKGTVVALLSGQVNTQTQSCKFLPTAAIIEVK